jgi:hypothetical protein
MFDVVDLGTKHGNAIAVFLKQAGKTQISSEFVKNLKPAKCVGFERAEGEKYRNDVTAKGFQFEIANLATIEGINQLPKSQVYLAWHFLEHLPDKSWSNKLVKVSLTNTQTLAWFRLPSFEQDEMTGEGVLRKIGLRFTWTNWIGHSSHWLVNDCVQSIKEWEKTQDRKFDLVIKPAGYIQSTEDKRVVPLDTPVDITAYNPKFGKKPAITFKKPIVAEWEVVVRFVCE